MPASPRPVFVLHQNAPFLERIRRAGGKAYAIRFFTSWPALRAAMADAPPATLLVLDPYEAGRRDVQLSPELRALLWEFPSATVVAALTIVAGRSHDLRTLGEWGVTDIIALDEDDTAESISRRLRAAQGRPLQVLLDRSLPSSVSGRARTLLMTAAEVVATGGRGKELARTLHLSERTVLRWAERAGLPPPRRLMAWMRILLAASLLDDPGRTVLSVAYACGYASDSSLRRAMQDFIGTIPTTLRREGAFARTSKLFHQELTELRTWGKDRGRAERIRS
ncbi:MAG: AraC family transcriptional regulator [Gemmatimonadetes bacterium]|nr:AraC family transcriptional regulator [Gemmatimonadota bacterium]